jgi:hypothetical protein
MDKTEAWIDLIDACQFSNLFVEELGWDRPITEKMNFNFGAETFVLDPVASYKGIQVWTCSNLPNARIQREIDKSISKISTERLIIFHDELHQNWRWPMSREASGKGIIRLVNHEHTKGQRTLSLIQRLQFIAISLQDEPPSLVEMLLRLRKAFDADQITKSFYKEFATHQKNLVSSIKGIENVSDKEWYSSLLLNRLMFIYFMQWKGFMDGNQNYLVDRLERIRKIQGPNQFYGFFKDFLLPLFHDGLGSGTKIETPKEIASLVGKIPYVNGGIFSEHELESRNILSVSDEAFEEIFTFFDKYQWHLDSRRTGNPKEINPDVLGYVFEQFVNNKEQGAYYTKEDVTDYMTSNALIIRLLQEIELQCDINILRPLVQNPNRYIWNSCFFGEESLHDQKYVDESYSLPGESIFETRARLERASELRQILANGNISNLSQLVTLNIDLELLVSDLIDGLDTTDDVVRIWNILSNLKVIDPTCGSGAFLFAALNQLEHLYSLILDVAELHMRTSESKELKELMSDTKTHSNRNYFVLKHATQNNLYGVDLMREAAEIARLRLFLKLISAVDTFEQIEPLPDLEFNIKSGNLLIGITKSEDLKSFMSTLDSVAFIEDTENQVTHLADLWDNFVLSQNLGPAKAKNAKKILANGTQILKKTLDNLLFEGAGGKNSKATFDEWRNSSTPFHWFVEFPDVFTQGGFDVVIGNPPYIKKGKIDYDLSGHKTSDCPDIYAMCMERASLISHKNGTFAMIVMSNLVFSDRFASLRKFLSQRYDSIWFSGYAKRPSLLFEGVQVRNAIFIGSSGEGGLFSAPMKRWTKEFRPHLMSTIHYSPYESDGNSTSWRFITSPKIASVFMEAKGNLKDVVVNKGPELEIQEGMPIWDKSLGLMHPLFFISNAYNWISSYKQVPPSEDGDGHPVVTSALNWIWFKDEQVRDVAFTLFVSKWMFAWWAMNGDDFNVTRENLLSFPCDMGRIPASLKKKLVHKAAELNEKMIQKVKFQKVTFPDKRVIKVGNWDLSLCKSLISEIDDIWSEILGASHLKDELLFQYFSTVKTVPEDLAPEALAESN